ncbi:MAG: bacillithiol biosynthesis BshC, partial [Bacteroidetes bacterium]
DTHFPVLVLRNSWLQITQRQQEKLAKLNASLPQLFLGKQAFTQWYMQTHTQQLFDISENIAQLEQVYAKLAEQATLVDTTLLPHVQALKTKALAKLYQVQKKMYRAEKRNHQEALNHIENLLNELFPSGQLQERVESGLYWWAVLGEQWVKLLVNQSVPLPDALCVATHP